MGYGELRPAPHAVPSISFCGRRDRCNLLHGRTDEPASLPTIDARYWTAILAASMCGANIGDFASRILGLGHTRGLLPLALIFLAIVWAAVQREA